MLAIMPPKTRKSTRTAARTTSSKSEIPDVYQDMLAEAVSSSPTRFGDQGQAVKRRKVGEKPRTTGMEVEFDPAPRKVAERIAQNIEEHQSNHRMTTEESHNLLQQQTTFDSSEDSEDSDADWEEVDIGLGGNDEEDGDGEVIGQDLDLTLGNESDRRRDNGGPRRKILTAVERKLRLEIQKMHILCLLVHIHMRNAWCNDSEAQATLRQLVSRRTRSYLNPAASLSHFQQNRSFIDGLDQAKAMWKEKFKRTACGMSRAWWVGDDDSLPKPSKPSISSHLDDPIDRTDFRRLAAQPEGSRDIGAQLFCTLLRSVGVETRLVCSLQPLPFASFATRSIAQHSRPTTAYTFENTARTVSNQVSETSTPLVPKRAQRLGLPPVGTETVIDTGVAPSPAKHLPRESPFPIYWIEALNPSTQKWIPVDPLITQTTNKPSAFEPPSSDSKNAMTYVIGFDTYGSTKDITRRYAKAYNAKTRRLRVEATKGGAHWLHKTLSYYKLVLDPQAEQQEDNELAAREAREPLPRNVQDFKDHPVYALERHLRRNEVIHPRRESGKVATGKLVHGVKAVEAIYRRSDVHIVKSADRWYRLGREIKEGEQPLKYVRARRGPGRREHDEELDEEDADPLFGDAETSLYIFAQTEVYVAPPVVRGKVPKNSYGNLDLYVPSMVPPGGVHITHPEAGKAARLIGIDYADAVTGFEFKGRHGTAVMQGVVVAAEFAEAINEVIAALEWEQELERDELRRRAALWLWRLFLRGLRVRERIQGYAIEGDDDAVLPREMEDKTAAEAVHTSDTDIDNHGGGGGGFFPDQDQTTTAEPTARHPPSSRLQQDPDPDRADADEGGGFLPDAPDNHNDSNHSKSNTTHLGTTPSAVPPAQRLSRTGSHSLFYLAVKDRATIDQEAARGDGTVGSLVPRLGGADGSSAGGGVDAAGRGVAVEDEDEGGARQVDDEKRSLGAAGAGGSGVDADVSPGPESDSDSLEQGSLLSHDPEDEDAEPEWLYS